MHASPAVEQKSNTGRRRLSSLARGRRKKFAYQLSKLKRKPPIEPFSGEVSIPPEEPNIHLNVTKSTPPNNSINQPRGTDSNGVLPESGHGEWGTAGLQPDHHPWSAPNFEQTLNVAIQTGGQGKGQSVP
ncbi:hypothetical protein BofuT4_P022060.1 [Botrytis cinerea T4]|uniref:Uncharacterized protein n=1 Tax=Botryotinia fuckeliana (strain T4) TaxID=999810 RepID=G2YGQ4_BOTF4|nr:hypothetical protein BofuT4_P022060.1 [Botrytis cinerea T4]